MNSIADSDAYRDQDCILPQHQAALTLLQARLSNPEALRVRWLDLACGRGQIIGSLDKNLSPKARSQLEYWGYDINERFTKETQKNAENLGLAYCNFKVGEISSFDNHYPSDTDFDFITLTNTVHEVYPQNLAIVLVDCVIRLSEFGTLFIYDMEKIRPPELGAVPWQQGEVQEIVCSLLDALGVSKYQPEVGQWLHRSCNAWNVQMQRQYFGIEQTKIISSRELAIEKTSKKIMELLEAKNNLCRKSLRYLTLYGAETAEEQEEKERLLYEFWAVSRALEVGK
jgi:SAM-dependent methyltransferase